MVGIQQNFVIAIEEEKESAKSTTGPVITTSYHVSLENILARVRFGKYVGLAADKFGAEAEQVMMAVLKHGRGNVRSIQDSLLTAGEDIYVQQGILDAIKALRDSKFIMPVPEVNVSHLIPCRSLSAEIFIDDEDDDSLPTGRGRKRSSSGVPINKKTASEAQPASKAKKTAKAAGRPKKSSANAKKTAHMIVAPEMRIYDEENEEGVSYTTSMAVDDAVMEPLMPLTATSSSAAPNVQIEHDETVYCVDFDRCNREFAKEACIEFVGEKIDSLASGIMREMFEISETSKLVSEDRLHYNLTNPENPKYNRTLATLPKERMKHYLDIMTRDKTGMLIRQSMGYIINHRSILDAVKQKLIESVVFDKFGADSLRIFRLLMMKKLLEQKQVAELAMTPIKNTRDCLYKMLQHAYVYLQEVPRTSEHNPSKTFYLWSVRLPHVQALLVTEMYKTLRNLRHRLNHTLTSHADLLAKRDEEQRIQQETPKYARLTDADLQTLADIQAIQERLEVSVIHLDTSIMTLEDF
jgi:transcription initiation factor IIE alpha subunit